MPWNLDEDQQPVRRQTTSFDSKGTKTNDRLERLTLSGIAETQQESSSLRADAIWENHINRRLI
jgi:hypothetical protein